MAKEAAEKFLDHLTTDTTLQQQVLSTDSMDGVMDFALGKGYVFTADEFQAALRDYPESMAADRLRSKLKIQKQSRPASAAKG